MPATVRSHIKTSAGRAIGAAAIIASLAAIAMASLPVRTNAQAALPTRLIAVPITEDETVKAYLWYRELNMAGATRPPYPRYGVGERAAKPGTLPVVSYPGGLYGIRYDVEAPSIDNDTRQFVGNWIVARAALLALENGRPLVTILLPDPSSSAEKRKVIPGRAEQVDTEVIPAPPGYEYMGAATITKVTPGTPGRVIVTPASTIYGAMIKPWRAEERAIAFAKDAEHVYEAEQVYSAVAPLAGSGWPSLMSIYADGAARAEAMLAKGGLVGWEGRDQGLFFYGGLADLRRKAGDAAGATAAAERAATLAALPQPVWPVPKRIRKRS